MPRAADKRVELMRFYADQGRSLKSILHLIGLSWETAMRYARRNGIAFHDHKRRYRKVEE